MMDAAQLSDAAFFSKENGAFITHHNLYVAGFDEAKYNVGTSKKGLSSVEKHPSAKRFPTPQQLHLFGKPGLGCSKLPGW